MLDGVAWFRKLSSGSCELVRVSEKKTACSCNNTANWVWNLFYNAAAITYTSVLLSLLSAHHYI